MGSKTQVSAPRSQPVCLPRLQLTAPNNSAADAPSNSHTNLSVIESILIGPLCRSMLPDGHRCVTHERKKRDVMAASY